MGEFARDSSASEGLGAIVCSACDGLRLGKFDIGMRFKSCACSADLWPMSTEIKVLAISDYNSSSLRKVSHSERLLCASLEFARVRSGRTHFTNKLRMPQKREPYERS